MAQPAQPNHDLPAALENHAVIAGFGVPGRAVADMLQARGIPFCVIELNPETVIRASMAGVQFISGDASQEDVLRRAGIDRAILFAVAMPNDRAVLDAIAIARRINPSLRILARCHYVSSGMEAQRRGANEVVVAEQVVAQEFERLLDTEIFRNLSEPLSRA